MTEINEPTIALGNVLRPTVLHVDLAWHHPRGRRLSTFLENAGTTPGYPIPRTGRAHATTPPWSSPAGSSVAGMSFGG
jgi:hypothetical protein